MYAQPAGVVCVPPTVVPHAEMVTKQEVKSHHHGQKEDEEGKVSLRELGNEVPVDGDAEEGQVQQKLCADILLLHQHNPDGHVVYGGASLSPKVQATGHQCLMWTHVHSATRQHRHIRA